MYRKFEVNRNFDKKRMMVYSYRDNDDIDILTEDNKIYLHKKYLDFKNSKREFPVTCIRDESVTDYPDIPLYF